MSNQHLKDSVSSFSERVFPGIDRVKGYNLISVLQRDSFNKMSNEDGVRLCLLLALVYVLMGQELRHVMSNEILCLVDDLYAWDAFPWGEYMWREFHDRVYNVVSNKRNTHLKEYVKLGSAYTATHSLYGFVFALKIFVLESFPNSSKNQSLWWRSSFEFFQQLETSNTETQKPLARKKFEPRICRKFVSKHVKHEVIKQVKHEVRVPVEEETVEEEEEVNEEVVDEGLNGMSKSELVKKLVDMERELTNYKTISTRLTAIILASAICATLWLYLISTIKGKLAYNEDRYAMFRTTVLGPWLDLRSEDHDNHILNFMLQHQKHVDNPSYETPVYFEIDKHTLEFGRREFCLITGLRFGKISLEHLKDSVSSFSERVFPGIYRVKERKTHLKEYVKLGSAYTATYSLYGFVFALKIFVLESFPNSRLWWKKEDNVIPRSVAWADHTKFNKCDYNRFFIRQHPSKTHADTQRKSITLVVKHEVLVPVEEETVEEEEEVNEEVVDEGLNGMSKSELVKKLVDMERELTNYKTISTRLTAIEQLLKSQSIPTMNVKAESIGLKIGEALTGGENSVIASNGVKGCETVCNNLVDVAVGVDYVVNKQNDDGVKKMSDVSVELSNYVNNRNLVDICVSVSNTFKDAYEGVNKHKHAFVEECSTGRVLETGTNGVNNCVTDPFDGDNTVVTKMVCVDKFVTNVATDHDVGVHASQDNAVEEMMHVDEEVQDICPSPSEGLVAVEALMNLISFTPPRAIIR
ncbi:phospholipase-like protein [Artemisia annua]|uniref:Phospholipase-like protein n=1 Tax=Artemisia annua TaxID=35608 RepID=A0A2U1PAZ4_ARTAN|nr:phospholipase-like protein [Artemisia annua]